MHAVCREFELELKRILVCMKRRDSDVDVSILVLIKIMNETGEQRHFQSRTLVWDISIFILLMMFNKIYNNLTMCMAFVNI